MYTKYNYGPSKIWNLDESGGQANKNGLGKVIARKGARKVQVLVPNEREWMTVLTIINAEREYPPHFYIFKEKRKTRCYVSKCEENCMWAMQNKGWMDSNLFPQWMKQFIKILQERRGLSPIKRHMVVLDGHKSHATLDVIVNAKMHGID